MLIRSVYCFRIVCHHIVVACNLQWHLKQHLKVVEHLEVFVAAPLHIEQQTEGFDIAQDSAAMHGDGVHEHRKGEVLREFF